MIQIVTGPIDSGKTSRLIQIYRQMEPGTADGFVSRKIYRDGILDGYDVVRLSDGESCRLATIAGRLEADLPDLSQDIRPLPDSEAQRIMAGDTFRFSRFIFRCNAFQFGRMILDEILERPEICELFLDEIGPVESRGLGFANLIPLAVQSGKNLHVGIRDTILDEIAVKFGLLPDQIIDLTCS